MENEVTPRVALVDPERLGRELLARALEAEGLGVVASTAHADALPEPPSQPGVVLVALRAELESSALRLVRERMAPWPSLVLAPGADALHAEHCCREGAAGFLARPEVGLAELVEAIHCVARGQVRFPAGATAYSASAASNSSAWKLQRLTPRERQVLAHVAAGHDNLKIAALLSISERTVKSHVISVYRKLDAENRVQLALLANQFGVGAPRS